MRQIKSLATEKVHFKGLQPFISRNKKRILAHSQLFCRKTNLSQCFVLEYDHLICFPFTYKHLTI